MAPGFGLFLTSLVVLVVMILPGTTSASSAPASLPIIEGSARPAEDDLPILLGVSLTHLLRAAVPASYTPPHEAAAFSFEQAQIVSVYGFPGICFMGELGCHEPAEAAARARDLARALDEANGERAAVPALHLIVAVAQPHPGADGTYLQWMPDETIREWVEVARREGVLLFLDVQIGWSEPLREVARLRDVLREPFVHLALDPEFATHAKALPPGDAIGTVDAPAVNEVQAYLAGIVRQHALPPKVLVLHQFQPGMLTNKAHYLDVPEVGITVDMDGFGGAEAKISGYEAYARVGTEHSAFKLFFHWDEPLLTPAQLQALPHPPDYVIYQ